MKAIILAAGLGSRFKEITKKTHKALLPIRGIPNLERTIQYLHDAEIRDIYIVTGHLKESFDYLIDKYNVKLIYNEKYREYNSIYSMYKVLDLLGDSFVIDSDVVLFKNIFLNKPFMSTYYTILRGNNNNEWMPIVINNKVVDILVSNENLPSLIGISYWTIKDANSIKDEFYKYINKQYLENAKLYWDNIPKSLLDTLNVTTKQIDVDSAYEMDNVDDYNYIMSK